MPERGGELVFFRGIAVPRADRDRVVEAIRTGGLIGGEGRWSMTHHHPGPLDELLADPALLLAHTRPNGIETAAVCACGEPDGAAYYAWRHNRSDERDTPIVVEFEARADLVAVDGKDFLYPVFQFGNPSVARDVLRRAFGSSILRYADEAWRSQEQGRRIALCDLAIHDPQVVAAHHASTVVLGGRHGTVFRNAFTVALPSSLVRSVRSTARPPCRACQQSRSRTPIYGTFDKPVAPGIVGSVPLTQQKGRFQSADTVEEHWVCHLSSDQSTLPSRVRRRNCARPSRQLPQVTAPWRPTSALPERVFGRISDFYA